MLLSTSVEIRTIENCQPSADHASAFLHSLGGKRTPLVPSLKSVMPLARVIPTPATILVERNGEWPMISKRCSDPWYRLGFLFPGPRQQSSLKRPRKTSFTQCLGRRQSSIFSGCWRLAAAVAGYWAVWLVCSRNGRGKTRNRDRVAIPKDGSRDLQHSQSWALPRSYDLWSEWEFYVRVVAQSPGGYHNPRACRVSPRAE